MQFFTNPARRCSDIVKKYMPALKAFYTVYKDFHHLLELGQQESRTASIIVNFL